MKDSLNSHTQIERTIELNWFDIIEALRKVIVLPEHAKFSVTFEVPTGGDWSGQTISVSDDNPVRVVAMWQAPDMNNPIHHRDKMREEKIR